MLNLSTSTLYQLLAILLIFATPTKTLTASMSLPAPTEQKKLDVNYLPTQKPTGIKHSQWPPAPDQERFFNTKFLSNYDQVNQSLQKEGFKDVWFAADDGVKINGLLLERSNASYTVISCSGFFPGRMEGMATLYPLLPNDCNILFFNARGHGKSEGYFKAKILMYGNSEYKDVIGAIAYAHKELAQKPILMHGVCMGSYNAAHALLDLQKRDILKNYNVKGFVFDSGFGSIAKISNALKYDLDNKIISKLFKTYVYTKDSKEEIRQRYLFIATRLIIINLFKLIQLCYVPVGWYREKATNLFDKIDQLPCPILYIHAKNDHYTPQEQAQRLFETKKLAEEKNGNCACSTCWWLEDSDHACIHLKQKEEYKQQLAAFIENALGHKKNSEKYAS